MMLWLLPSSSDCKFILASSDFTPNFSKMVSAQLSLQAILMLASKDAVLAGEGKGKCAVLDLQVSIRKDPKGL